MRAIQKEREPKELTEYRSKSGAIYHGDASFTPVRTKICEHLLAEQSHLCAYCMQRISADTMQVEHWHCRKNHPSEQLDYKNMLGVCSDKTPTCDTPKKHFDLKYNPANPAHRIESHIKYAADGIISSDDQEFDQQLNKVLNLNYDYLRKNRESIVKAVDQALDQRPGSRTEAEITKILKRWQNTNTEGQLQPYSGVAIYFLTKRLKQASRNN
jgi:uncharacterized protein (TIGR02646 family)